MTVSTLTDANRTFIAIQYPLSTARIASPSVLLSDIMASLPPNPKRLKISWNEGRPKLLIPPDRSMITKTGGR